jgi:two-component system sensor histidine kinase/response regulator
MKGRVELTSEVGQGSTFAIVMPLELQAVAGAKNEIVANDADLHGKRVLIADDNAINRLIAEEWLTANGAEAKCVNDGTEALAEVRRARSVGNSYHLLLLDARMPGMDGVTLAQLLIGGRRDQVAIAEAIVVMLMSDELALSLSRLRESGLDPSAHCRYVVKPLKRADVLGAILGALALNRNGAAHEQMLPQLTPAVARDERSLRILLAEDSVDNRLLVEAFLKQQPYTLEFAENGQVAIDRVLAASYDLVLMDIQMPMVDGYTAVRRIREWERIHDLPRVPIIALTASALDEAVRMSLEAGCDAHIAKPVRKATLLEAIRKGTSSRWITESATDYSKEAQR